MSWFSNRRTVLASAMSAVLMLLGLAISATTPATVLRERIFDLLLRPRNPAGPQQAVIVVDIDSDALRRYGRWPWTRERLASVIEAIADGKPKALGIDILLIGDDERSAGALARQLAATTTDDRAARFASFLAAQLPDADQALATALRRVPSVIGLALDADAEVDAFPGVPVLTRSPNGLTALGASEGTFETSAVGSPKTIAEAAKGQGLLLLPGDADARIRRVPLIVATRAAPRPGLALETARVAQAATSFVLRGDPVEIVSGSMRLGTSSDGMLRLRPVSDTARQDRVVPVASVIEDKGVRERFEGRVVLLGSSAPEGGGLRPSAAGPLVASVQLQADALEQIMRADTPLRPDALPSLEAVAALIAALGVTAIALSYSPLIAGVITLVISGAWTAASYVCSQRLGVLLDPLLVPGISAAGFAVAVLTAATETRRRESLIRRRFEQHLAPEIVRRIVAEPHLLKLKGEARVITALFTDIEGFTAMTERAEPAELIAVLDRYIDGATRIVVEHGGLVEKIVGDGFHAIFNAPFDLANHPTRAMECAVALQAFSSALRQEPDALKLRLGRTRIGIETGPVIVGDVGGGRRLDYTAHGNTMNRAARLEAANKELGTAICIGPGAAQSIGHDKLRPLGNLTLRGVNDPLAVYTVWPEEWSDEDRRDYRGLVGIVTAGGAEVSAALVRLKARFPQDGAVEGLVMRLEASPGA